jgi:hypothetical protein
MDGQTDRHSYEKCLIQILGVGMREMEIKCASHVKSNNKTI